MKKMGVAYINNLCSKNGKLQGVRTAYHHTLSLVNFFITQVQRKLTVPGEATQWFSSLGSEHWFLVVGS